MNLIDEISITNTKKNCRCHFAPTVFLSIRDGYLVHMEVVFVIACRLESYVLYFITTRKRSCRKVMFLHLWVSVPWGVVTALGRHPLGSPPRQPPSPRQTPPAGQTSLQVGTLFGRHHLPLHSPPPETGTEVGGTHPTGMHS